VLTRRDPAQAEKPCRSVEVSMAEPGIVSQAPGGGSPVAASVTRPSTIPDDAAGPGQEPEAPGLPELRAKAEEEGAPRSKGHDVPFERMNARSTRILISEGILRIDDASKGVADNLPTVHIVVTQRRCVRLQELTMANSQSYKTHRRVVPAYHFGVLSALLAYFIWSVYELFQGVTGASVMGLILSVALMVFAISIRSQILRVQDRVIRLEMRLRLRENLPADLATRAAHLPVRQLIALRFASNEELPELVREVLDGKVMNPNDIKQRIREWQADHLRA
jgi:hypothetical protein